MKNEQKKGDIKALQNRFFPDEEKIPKITLDKFLALQTLYKTGECDLEVFMNCRLDLTTIDLKQFSSREEFFEEYDEKCIKSLYNYSKIRLKIGFSLDEPIVLSDFDKGAIASTNEKGFKYND
jgi:hypothetical protein